MIISFTIGYTRVVFCNLDANVNKVPVEGKTATTTEVTRTTAATTTPAIPWQYQVLTTTGAEIQESSTQTLLKETTVFPVVQSAPTEIIPDATTSTATTTAPNSTEALTMEGPNTASNPEQEIYRPITTTIETTESTQKPITVATNPAVKSVMPAEPSSKTVESMYGALKPIDAITKPFVNTRGESDYPFKFQEVANEGRVPVTLPAFFTADIQKNAMNSYVQQWTLMPKGTIDFRKAGEDVNYSYPLLNVSKNEQFGYNPDLLLRAAQNVMEISNASETSDEVVESKSKTGFKTSEETPTGIYEGPTEIPSKQTEIETKPTETPIATQAVTKYEEIATSPTTTPQQIGLQISNATGYQYPQDTAPEIQPTQLPYYAKDKFTPPSNNPTRFNISRLLARLGTTVRSSKPPSGPSTLATNLTVSDYLSLLEAKESQGENPYAVSYYGGAEAGHTQQPETSENGNSINQYEYGTPNENKNETNVLSPCQMINACSSNVTNYDMRLDITNAVTQKKFSGHSDTSETAINDGSSKDANGRTEIINMNDESNKPPPGEVVIPTTQSTGTTPHIIIEAPKPDEELLEDLEDKNREEGLEKPVKWPFNLNPIALPPGFVKVNQYAYPSVSIEKVRGEKSSSNKFLTPVGEINTISEVSKGQKNGPTDGNFKENLKGEFNSDTEDIQNTTRSDVVHELNPITQKLASTTKETMESTEHIITTSTTGATRTIATTSVPIVIKTKSGNWDLSPTAIPFINIEVKTKGNAESISDKSSKVTYKENEEEKTNNEYTSMSSIATTTPIATTVLQTESEENKMLQHSEKIVPTNKETRLTNTGDNEDLMKQALNTKEEEKGREGSLVNVRQKNLIENFNQYQDLSQNIMVENVSSESQLSRDRNTSLQHVAVSTTLVSTTPSGPDSTQASAFGIFFTESSTNEPKPKDFENLNVQGPSIAHPTGPTTLSEARVDDFKNKDVEGPSLALPTKKPTRPTIYQYTITPITASVEGQNEFIEQAPSTTVIQNSAVYQNTQAPTTSSFGGQNVSTEQNPLTPVIQNVTTYPFYQNPYKENYPPISNTEQSLSVNTTSTTTTQLPLTSIGSVSTGQLPTTQASFTLVIQNVATYRNTDAPKVASTGGQNRSTEQTLTTPVIQNVATYPIYQKPFEENYLANSNSELSLTSNTTSTTTTELPVTSASSFFTEKLSTAQPSSKTAIQNVATYQNTVAPTGTSTDGENVFAEQTLTTPVIQNKTYSIYQNPYKENNSPNPTPEQSFAGNTSSATTSLLPEKITSSVSTEHLSIATETASTTQIPIYYTATVSPEQQTPNTGTSTTLSQDTYKEEIVSTKSPPGIVEDTTNHSSPNVYGFASYFDYLRDYYTKIQKLYMSSSTTYENTENNTVTDHQKIISNTITSPPEATTKRITPQEIFETPSQVFANSEDNNNAMAVQQTASISTSTDELNVYPADTSTKSYPTYSDSNGMFQQNLLKNNSKLDSLTNQVYMATSTTPTPLQVEQYPQQSNSDVSQDNNLIQKGEDLTTTINPQQEVTSTQSDKALTTQATMVSEQFIDQSFNRTLQNSNSVQQDVEQNQGQVQNTQNQPNDNQFQPNNNQVQQGWPYKNQQNQMQVFTTQSTTPKVLSVPVIADNNTGAKQQEEGADLEEEGIFEHTDDEMFKIKPVTTAGPSSKPSTTSKPHIVTQVYQTQYAPNNGFAIKTNNPVTFNKPATGNLLTMSVKPTQNPNINLTAVEKGDSIQIKMSTKPPPANAPQIATLYPDNAATPYPNLQNKNEYPQQQQTEISTTPSTESQSTLTSKVPVSMPKAIELPTNKPAISEEVIPDATTSTASLANTAELQYGNTYPSSSTLTTTPVNENQQNQGNPQLKPTVAPKVSQKRTNETQFTPTMIQNVHQTNQQVTDTVSNNLTIENVITNPCAPSCAHTDLYPEGYGGVMEPVASTETNMHQENGYSTALNLPLQTQEAYTGKPMNLYEESTTETTAGPAAQTIQNTTVSFQTQQQPNSYSSSTLEVTSPATQTSPSITNAVYLPSLVGTTSQGYQFVQNETKTTENSEKVTQSMSGNNQAVRVTATSTEPVKPTVIKKQDKNNENLISTTTTSTTVTVPPVTQTISPIAGVTKTKSMNNQGVQLITTTTESFETSAQPAGYLGTGTYSQTAETATTGTTLSGASNQPQEYAPGSIETTSIMPQAVTPVSAETYYTTGLSTTTTTEVLPQQVSSTVLATLPYLVTGQQANPYQEGQYQTTTTFNVPVETQKPSALISQVNPITSPVTTKTTTEGIKPTQNATATTTATTKITSKMQPNTSSETFYPAGETATSTELLVVSTSTIPSTIYGGGNGFTSYEEYLADYYKKLQDNYNGIQNQAPIAYQQSPISTKNPLEQQAKTQTSSTKGNIGIQQTVNENHTQEKVTNPTTPRVTNRSVESATVTSKPVDSETATKKPTVSSVTSQSSLKTERTQSSEIQTTTTLLSEDKSKNQSESQETTTSSSEIQSQSQQTLSAGRNSPTYKPTPLYQANDIWWTVNDVTNLKETEATSKIASITSPTMRVTTNQFIALTPEINAFDNTLSVNGNNNNLSNKEESTQSFSQVSPEVTVTKYKPAPESTRYMGFSSYQEYLADYYKKIHLLYAKKENEIEQNNNNTISETNAMGETSADMIINNIENNADISGLNATTQTTDLATKAKIETIDKEKSVKTELSFSSETQEITEVTTTSTTMETSTITPPPFTLRNEQTAEKAATVITTTSTAITEAPSRTDKLSSQGLQTETATTEITKISQLTTKPALNGKAEEISTTVPTTTTLATTTTTESAQPNIDMKASSAPEEKEIKSPTTESSSRNKPPTSIPIVTMEIDILPKMNEHVTTKPTPSRSQLTTGTSKPPTTVPENTLNMIENIEVAPTAAATTSEAKASNNKFPTKIPSKLSHEKEQTYKPVVTSKGENLLEIIENIEKSEEPVTPTRSYKFTTAVPFELSLQNTEPFNFDYGSKIGISNGKTANMSDTDLVVDYLPQLINALSTSPQDANPVTEAGENINQQENNIEPVTDNSNPNHQELNENTKQDYGNFNPSIDVGKPESQLLDALKTAMNMEPTIKPSIVATTPSSPIVFPVDSLMTKRSTESNEEQAVSTTSSMFLKATTEYNKYSFDEINDVETDNKVVAQNISAPVLSEEKPYAVPSFPNANPVYETKETSSVFEGTVNAGNNLYHTSSHDENQHDITIRPTVPITGNKVINKAESSATVHPDIATAPIAKATEYQNKAEKATNNIMESIFTQKAQIYDSRVNTNFPNILKTEAVTTKYPFNDVYYDYVYNWKRYLQEIQNWVNRYMVPIEHRNISVHPDLHPTFAQSSSRYQSEYEQYLANLEQWEAKNRVNQLLGISTTPKSPSSVTFSALRPYPRPNIESQIKQPNNTDEYKYSTAAASNNATETKSDSLAEPNQKTQHPEEALKQVFFENTTPAVPKNINILTGQRNIQNPNYVVTNGQPLTEPNVNKVSQEHLYNDVPRTPYAVYQPVVTYKATARNEYIHSAETQKETSAVQTSQEFTSTPVRTYSFETTTTKPDTNNQQSTTTESSEIGKVNANKEITVTSANVNGGNNSADNVITRTEVVKTDSPASSTTMSTATTQQGLYSTCTSTTTNCQGQGFNFYKVFRIFWSVNFVKMVFQKQSSKVYCKKDVLKIFAKYTKNTCVGIFISPQLY